MDPTPATSNSFQRTFGVRPTVLSRAPGRVNLIGEHTDYNDGFVLPCAICRCVEVAAGPGDAGVVKVYSRAFDEQLVLPYTAAGSESDERWHNYVRGVVEGLRRRDITLPGMNLYIGGDLPTACGLSSSAALCVALALAMIRLAEVEFDAVEIVHLARTAESEFVGTPCGIMDPYVSMFAPTGHAILLDCRSLEHQDIPLQLRDYELLAVPSGVRRELASGSYEQRVQECRQALTEMQRAGYDIETIRDLNTADLEACHRTLDPVLTRRVRHVVTENDRVHRFAAALHRGQTNELGNLLDESHASLRNDYEVSCPEIEDLVTHLRDHKGVIGARMIGGGFGGTVLALVRKDAIGYVTASIETRNTKPQGDSRAAFVVRPADGADCPFFR